MGARLAPGASTSEPPSGMSVTLRDVVDRAALQPNVADLRDSVPVGRYFLVVEQNDWKNS